MSTFNIGDIVTGTTPERYCYTSDKATMRVLETNNSGEIYLEILTSEEPEKQIGAKYWVYEKYFKLVTPINQVKEL